MSAPVELAFREQLAAQFAADLAGRVYDLVSPPDVALPLATYRCLDGDATATPRRARILVALRDTSYSAVKRLQQQVEAYFAGLVRTWMGTADPVKCRVWVYSIDVATRQDGFQAATRQRVAMSEFVIRYADIESV